MELLQQKSQKVQALPFDKNGMKDYWLFVDEFFVLCSIHSNLKKIEEQKKITKIYKQTKNQKKTAY